MSAGRLPTGLSRFVALVMLASLLVVQGLAASPAWHHLLHVEQGSAGEQHHHDGSGDSDDESGCPVALFAVGAVDHGLADPIFLGAEKTGVHQLALPVEGGAPCVFLVEAVLEHAPPRG